MWLWNRILRSPNSDSKERFGSSNVHDLGLLVGVAIHKAGTFVLYRTYRDLKVSAS
jgi:hypothetical protein